MINLTNFFALASDETRLRIMILLAQEELCVCELCGILKLSQPKVSKHLGKLRDTKYVTSRQEGKFVFYSLNVSDKVIMDFINNIILNLNNYPQLKADKERSSTKEVFLDGCSCICNFNDSEE